MATKADFTDEEWRTLQKGVTGAGMLVSVSDADFTDSFGEASALAKSLAAEHDQSQSPFVRELTAVRGTGFGITSSKQEVETETRAALSAAVTTLSAKAPDEIDTYRELVLDVATAVAEAKGGVKESEAAAIEAIKGALGGT
jgi:tellurite resistance protein